MQVSARRAPRRQLWPPGSRIIVGVYKTCCRLMCHRLGGPHPSNVGVPHMPSNALLSAGAGTTISCGATCKVLCHNICVIIQAVHELGIVPTFAQAHTQRLSLRLPL